MNKKLFNIIGSFFVAGLLLAGCDQETEGTMFDAKGKDQYAVGSVVRTVEMIPQDNNSFKVDIVRVDATADANVNVALDANTVAAGVFTLASPTVSFKAGEYKAFATVKYADINKLSPTSQYKMTLSLSADVLSPSKKKDMAITAFRKLTYESIGVSVFTSEAFGEDDGTRNSWNVQTLKAKEGDVYLLKDLYSKGYDIQMVILDGKATIAPQPAWKHSTYGNVYVKTTVDAVVNGKNIDMTIDHHVQNLGSFGKFFESITLP